jgi:hypothetical protein
MASLDSSSHSQTRRPIGLQKGSNRNQHNDTQQTLVWRFSRESTFTKPIAQSLIRNRIGQFQTEQPDCQQPTKPVKPTRSQKDRAEKEDQS